MSEEPWYGVRCVFEHPDEDSASGEHWYEERITLWRAASFDEAVKLAEAEAEEYATVLNLERTPVLQAFHIASSGVGSSTEVFSLIRGSRLTADAYVESFFDTGAELQTDTDHD